MPHPGHPLAIRPLAASDAAAFHAFVLGLSGESRLNRFMAPVRELAPERLRVLTHADQARHVAFAALQDEEIVGEARYVRLGESGRAEFALAVADRLQRRGIGSRLMGSLVDAARRAGLAALEGEMLGSNSAMQALTRKAGFRLRRCPGDATVLLAELGLL